MTDISQEIGKKLKPMRYSDRELSVIKNSFFDMDFLISIRKFLLQGEMTVSEIGVINTAFASSEVFAILRKSINPPLDKMAMPFQTVDLFSNMDLQPVPVDHAVLIVGAKALAKEYLDQRFQVLGGKEVADEIKFDDLVKPLGKLKKDQTYMNFVARNFLLSHIDSQLFGSLLVIAGTKDETAEEQKARLSQNSNK